MKKLLVKVSIGIVLAIVMWLFVGVERIVDDHELGISWQIFIKHRQSLQVQFENPIQDVDIIPLEKLSASEEAAFLEFCDIRFGVTDITHCYALIIDRII